jgi:uncharacterized YigZ family protein
MMLRMGKFLAMGVTSYLTIAREGETELADRGSRFRCTLARVADEEGARSVLEKVRRRDFDAGHHCVAWVVGPERAIEHAGDDGEPPGTAGAPMLEVLRGRGLSDTVAVVSRWFGGTLLGTGGLVRAYGDALREGLDVAGVQERVLQDLCEVEVDIAAVGRLEHDLRSRGARVLGVEYTGEALLRFAVPPVARSVVDEIVAELTSGAAVPRVIGQEWVDSGA